MKKIHFQIRLIVLFALSCLLFNGCKEKRNTTENLNGEKQYEFERKLIVYELGNNLSQELEIYISKNNDTVGNQNFFYSDKVLDSTKSRFYTLTLEKITDTDEYSGIISYYFNPKEDGELSSFDFTVISRTDEKTDFVSFDNYNIEKNNLEFKFKNKSDTLLGFIYAQHSTDTIDNGEDKVRIREIFIAVDNYEKTNNPFVEGPWNNVR